MPDIKKIITIDGPAGSGKSTIAKALAKDLGFIYIDTGAMYRALTLMAIENNIDLENEEDILEIARSKKMDFDNSVIDKNDYTKVMIDGRDVTNDIRSEEVGKSVSIVSKLSKIRKYLVNLQRELAYKYDSVLEGRDTGSVVCPDAILKIFLTASIDERVRRRKRQIHENGKKTDEKAIREEIEMRDKIDSGRQDSPLIIPEDGLLLDTTGMGIDDVIETIKKVYKERLNDGN
jgi:CMP/dCMP kinase